MAPDLPASTASPLDGGCRSESSRFLALLIGMTAQTSLPKEVARTERGASVSSVYLDRAPARWQACRSRSEFALAFLDCLQWILPEAVSVRFSASLSTRRTTHIGRSATGHPRSIADGR